MQSTAVRRILCAAGVILGAATSATAAAPTGAPAPAGRLEYQEAALDNGLRIITCEDFSCPVVAVQLWYHVGSKDEDPQRQGFAHMFEHMMFRGTDRLGPTDHFDHVRRAGGDCNAYTSFDQTVYVQTVPANQLEMVLWLEAERMSFLKIDQESFDTERKVVEEERRLGLNRPYGTLPEKILAEIYKQHPYRWSTIGQIPHLRAASVAELRAFWTRFYVPNNATLVIVGAVDHKTAQDLARKCFGWIPRYEDPPRITVRDPLPTSARSITLKEDNAPAPAAGILFRTVPLNHPDVPALEMLASILGGGASSRVYRELVAEKQLAAFAAAGAMSFEQDGIFGAGAVLTPLGGKTEPVLEALERQIERLRNEPVSEDELLKARNNMLRGIVTGNQTVASKASALGRAAVLEGDAARVNERLNTIAQITADDLLRVARTHLAPERAMKGTVERNLMGTLGSWLGFKKTEEDAPITAAPETEPPPPGRPGLARPADVPAQPPAAPAMPYDASLKYASQKLPNGIELLVVENHELPFVSATLYTRAGGWTESKPGTASMAFSMLTKGTENYDEGKLAAELDTYAITLAGFAGLDNGSVGCSFLTEHADRAVRLMAEVVRRPTFPDDEFEKLRRQTLTGLGISKSEPSYLADRELRRQMFGTHPYARTATGEYEDVLALAPEDARNWWRQFIRPEESTLIVAGDIDLRQAAALAAKYFGDWKNETPPVAIDVPQPPAPAPTHIYLVDFPGVQSQIRVGQLGITRRHPGYFTSRVAGGYFGGAFSSRLNDTIRVKKGLTYGARGGWSADRMAGRFVVSTFSKTESTVEALRAMFDEIERLRSEPPSDKELGDTRAYILGSFAGDRETPQAVAGDLWLVRSNGLGDDYLKQLLDGVARCTAQDCVKLATETIDPTRMVVVVVGPAEKLREPLASIAPVTVVAQEPEEPEPQDQ